MQLDNVHEEAERARQHFFSLGKTYVGGAGGFHPRVMIVGDVPTAQAAEAQAPFVRHTRIVLNQLIALAGLEYEECWFTNLLKYRTPSNRPPNHAEALAFRGVLKTEWCAVGRPSLVVAIGPAAYMSLTGQRPNAYGEYVRLTNAARATFLHNPSLGLTRADMRETIENEWKNLSIP